MKISLLLLTGLLSLCHGFNFLDVVPRSSGTAQEEDPSLFCRVDNKRCLVAYKVTDGGTIQIGVRKSVDGGRNWGGLQIVANQNGSRDASLSCSGNFCVLAFRVGTAIGASISTNFGTSFGSPVQVHSDGTGVSAPSVNCFKENAVDRCFIGLKGQSAGDFFVYRISSNVQAPAQFQQITGFAGDDVDMKCLNDAFCLLVIGGEGADVSVVKKVLGDDVNLFDTGNAVQIAQSIELQALGGAISTQKPRAVIIDANNIAVASADKKPGTVRRINLAKSSDGGATFARAEQIFANAQADSDQVAISCFNFKCSLVWEVDKVDAPNMFITTDTGFAAFSIPDFFQGFITKAGAAEDMYDDPDLVCFDDECLAVTEGRNFLNGVNAQLESITTSTLVLPTNAPTRSPLALGETFAPTNNPTVSPTTSQPTNNPTVSPTTNPTNTPTTAPSRSPLGVNETYSPTGTPTVSPTPFVEQDDGNNLVPIIAGISGVVGFIVLVAGYSVFSAKKGKKNPQYEMGGGGGYIYPSPGGFDKAYSTRNYAYPGAPTPYNNAQFGGPPQNMNRGSPTYSVPKLSVFQRVSNTFAKTFDLGGKPSQPGRNDFGKIPSFHPSQNKNTTRNYVNQPSQMRGQSSRGGYPNYRQSNYPSNSPMGPGRVKYNP